MTGSPKPDVVPVVHRTLARLRAIRSAGIPYQPTDEIASLRASLAAGDLETALRQVGLLEAGADQVDAAWPGLARLSETLSDRLAGSSADPRVRPLDALEVREYLEGWDAPFRHPSELAQRASTARDLTARLPAISTAAEPTVDSRPMPAASAPTAPPKTRRSRRWPPAVAGVGRWLPTPSGWTFLIVIAFVFVGGYVRLHALGGLSLWNDEAQSTLVAFSILQYGHPVIQSAHLINNYEPLYPYLEAGSVALLGHSNFAYRLPSALVGIALIPIAYYVGSRLRDRYVGIALAAMVTFSSEYIAWSRQARWYMLLVAIMGLAFLLATLWARASSRSKRMWGLLGLAALTALAALSSASLFLLYVPAILAGVAAYAVVRNAGRIRRFFGYGGATAGAALDPTLARSYRRRRLFLILGAVVVVSAAVLAAGAIGRGGDWVLARVLGFAPYPVAWSPLFGAYLVQYYLGVVLLALLGAVLILRRGNPAEVALVVFCGAAFLSVSALASLTNNVSSGAQAFERHLVPLLFFLFLVAAIALVETTRWAVEAVRRWHPTRPTLRPAQPAVFGIAVLVLLVLPGIVVPSGVTVHQHPSQFPSGNLVPWDPFAVSPAEPSAIYQAQQSDYQRATSYVAAHRASGDVVAATTPGPPAVYLGSVQYWVRGNADPNTVITTAGQPEFYQTGSRLVATTGQLEGVLFNDSGWLISDVPRGAGPPFPGGMNLVLADLMTNISVVWGPSISLYHWNRTSPLGVLATIESETPNLSKYGSNLTALVDWAATFGSTISKYRPLVLPFESALIPFTAPGTTPLAVLYLVYNEQTQLQNQYPEVLNATNFSSTGLVVWAKGVVNGTIADPAAFAELAPYASYYDSHG